MQLMLDKCFGIKLHVPSFVRVLIAANNRLYWLRNTSGDLDSLSIWPDTTGALFRV